MEKTRYTKLRSEDEENIIRYLLGALPEAESDRFEQLYLRDEALFDQLSEIEDELIDDYAGGALDDENRERFEQNFLRSPERCEKTQLAVAMTEHAAAWKVQKELNASSPSAMPHSSRIDSIEPNRPQATVLTFKRWLRPVPAWREWAAIAAAVLIAVGTAALWFRNRGLDRQLLAANVGESRLREQTATQQARAAQAESQRDAERESSNDLKNQVQALTEQVHTLAGEAQSVKKIVVSAFIGIEYLANVTRGIGESKTKMLAIPLSARTVRLGVEFPESRFQNFAATLLRADGNSMLPIKTVGGRTRGDKQSVTLIIPATKLQSGDYDLLVDGITPQDHREGVGRYHLTIVRR